MLNSKQTYYRNRAGEMAQQITACRASMELCIQSHGTIMCQCTPAIPALGSWRQKALGSMWPASLPISELLQA